MAQLEAFRPRFAHDWGRRKPFQPNLDEEGFTPIGLEGVEVQPEADTRAAFRPGFAQPKREEPAGIKEAFRPSFARSAGDELEELYRKGPEYREPSKLQKILALVGAGAAGAAFQPERGYRTGMEILERPQREAERKYGQQVERLGGIYGLEESERKAGMEQERLENERERLEGQTAADKATQAWRERQMSESEARQGREAEEFEAEKLGEEKIYDEIETGPDGKPHRVQIFRNKFTGEERTVERGPVAAQPRVFAPRAPRQEPAHERAAREQRVVEGTAGDYLAEASGNADRALRQLEEDLRASDASPELRRLASKIRQRIRERVRPGTSGTRRDRLGEILGQGE